MFIPFIFIINYNSPFYWWFGPILQILGFCLLYATRFTSRYYPSWGRKYYIFSSIVRPLGILLIGWAWVEILTNPPSFILPENISFSINFLPSLLLFLIIVVFSFAESFLRRFSILIFILIILSSVITILVFSNTPLSIITGVMIAILFSIWSIFSLGLRRSFLYSKFDDPLITNGPYKYQRHPQLAAALIIACLSILVVHPRESNSDNQVIFGLLNLVVMLFSIIIVIRSEEKDLVIRYGDSYINYINDVPALFSFSKRKHRLPKKHLLFLTIPCYLLALLWPCIKFIAYDYLPNNNSSFYLGMNARLDACTNISWWDMRRFTYVLRDNNLPEILNDDILNEWRRDSRTIKLTPYPHTLFYCDQIYYSIDIDPSENGYNGFNIVKEIPFELICNENQIEFAQAMDYDNDGFPQIYLLKLNKEKPNHLEEPILAADDFINVYHDEIIERMTEKETSH